MLRSWRVNRASGQRDGRGDAAWLVGLSLALAMISGCVASLDVWYTPVRSGLEYGPPGQPEPRTFRVVDARSDADRPFHTGSFRVDLRTTPDEIAYLGENLERVLQGAGIDIRNIPGPEAALELRVKRFRIRNRHKFDKPYHTFLTFRGDLRKGDEMFPIVAYFKASQPVSDDFSKVVRPCYQLPLEAIVLEIAAKMNQLVFGRVAPRHEVEALIAAAPAPVAILSDESFLDVLRLGFTNDPLVIPVLVKLTSHTHGAIRMSAVSALGTIGAVDQFDLLRSFYRRESGVALLFAVKSIGDLRTESSRQTLDALKISPDYSKQMIREIVELYD